MTKFRKNLCRVIMLLTSVFLAAQGIAQMEFAHPPDIVVQGHLSRDQVLKVINPHLREIDSCFRKSFGKEKDLYGRATAVFTAKAKTGKAIACKVRPDKKLNQAKFVTCLENIFCKLQYGNPAIDTDVLFPMKF